MAIRLVVTRGYGNGTFNGTIPFVVTRGYTIGAAIIREDEGGGTRSERANRKLSRKIDNRSRSVVGSGRSLVGRNLGRR